MLDVMIIVENDLVGLKWAFMSLQTELSDLLPGHIGVYFIDTLEGSVNSGVEMLWSVKAIINSALEPAENQSFTQNGKPAMLGCKQHLDFDTDRGDMYNLSKRLNKVGKKN